jgi:type IV pilus assembly protein PilB
MYHCLNEINAPHLNIATVEDPVEIVLPGVHQVSVHEAIGLDFATTLRALLRQDPDVLMVGEIRDLATARVAVQAAQTGHLVLSTLHCNDAVHALVRLQDLGLPGYHVATCLRLITAQRLVRRLCLNCRQPHDTGQWTALGCPQCKSGYRGRVGLFEVLPISPAMQAQVISGANALALSHHARSEGIATMREDGIERVQLGQTSLSEVEGATHG